MIGPKTIEAINEQINMELYSAYLYQAMSAHFAVAGFKGVANWLDVQTKEEMFHARKLYDYMLSQGGKVVFKPIDAPPAEVGTPLVAFQSALEHEKKVTASINNLVSIAIEEGDRASEIFLQWFVTEQVEEEENANDVIDKLKLAGENGPGLFMVDNELADRVFTSASAEV
jgi:ferritin